MTNDRVVTMLTLVGLALVFGAAALNNLGGNHRWRALLGALTFFVGLFFGALFTIVIIASGLTLPGA